MQGTKLAISMWNITLAQWNSCVSHGACPEYENAPLRESESVIGLEKDVAERYASWLSKITEHTYAALLPEKKANCTHTRRHVGSNRWDWMQDYPEQDCADSQEANNEGFRVTRIIEPAS